MPANCRDGSKEPFTAPWRRAHVCSLRVSVCQDLPPRRASRECWRKEPASGERSLEEGPQAPPVRCAQEEISLALTSVPTVTKQDGSPCPIWSRAPQPHQLGTHSGQALQGGIPGRRLRQWAEGPLERGSQLDSCPQARAGVGPRATSALGWGLWGRWDRPGRHLGS